MVELLTDPAIWIAFFTLTALELVLGIDNIIFISILVDKLPKERREFARKIGLFGAMFMRIGLLVTLAWIVGMTKPIFSVFSMDFSGRDLVLLFGGLFLIWKSTSEIHESLEAPQGEHNQDANIVKATFTSIILQIMVIDLVFSLDSIITAVGMVKEIEVMIAAVIASVGMMMLFAGPIGNFVSDHPTIKMLALSFLVTVGIVLMAEGFGHHVPKGYIYAAMGFSLVVELLNIKLRKNAEKPVELRQDYTVEPVANKQP
jgi:predicted tellurium resistance membrane protein TerC